MLYGRVVKVGIGSSTRIVPMIPHSLQRLLPSRRTSFAGLLAMFISIPHFFVLITLRVSCWSDRNDYDSDSLSKLTSHSSLCDGADFSLRDDLASVTLMTNSSLSDGGTFFGAGE